MPVGGSGSHPGAGDTVTSHQPCQAQCVARPVPPAAPQHQRKTSKAGLVPVTRISQKSRNCQKSPQWQSRSVVKPGSRWQIWGRHIYSLTPECEHGSPAQTDRQPPQRPSLTAPSTALQRCQQPGRDHGAFAHCSGPDSSSFQWLVLLTWVLWYSLKQLRTLIYASKFIYQRINDYLIMFVWIISSHYIPLQCELGASMTAM